MTGSHAKRWVTGIVAVPVLFSIVFFGSEGVFAGFILAVTAVAILEYNRLVFGQAGGVEKRALMFFGLLAPLAAAVSGPGALLAVTVLSTLLVFILTLFGAKEGALDLNPIARYALGTLYLPVMLSHFILLREGDRGVLWIFFVIVLAFSGDIAAFYVGRIFGRRKLMPHVSPGKTVEGLLGLAAGSVAGCLLYRYFLLPEVPAGHIAVIGLAGGVIGQLGDLFESLIKRASGAKDSGGILPGHGGILDRLDCLLFIVPFVYYYRTFVLS
ncbi:MAG: Phosphatidate cytidylyltransferase [Syntrophaceae bacterium PtaB.Bin038]|nr:MAG: Phosphatidate cytidylyltransferase [Syntrophaceae bacterium PtaB.Bin038]